MPLVVRTEWRYFAWNHLYCFLPLKPVVYTAGGDYYLLVAVEAQSIFVPKTVTESVSSGSLRTLIRAVLFSVR